MSTTTLGSYATPVTSRTRQDSRILTILWVLVGLKLLLHVLTSIFTPYGLHRDEFLYLALGRHLDWGFREVPPFIAGAAALIQSTVGESLFTVRLLPALAGCFVVLCTGLMTRLFGGRRFALLLSVLAVFIAPVYLRANTLFQPVSFDQLFWVLAAYLFALRMHREDPRIWLLLGVACGVGLLNKYSMLLFGFGLFVGIILTPARRDLATRWPWLAALIALALALPNLLWQMHHDWPLFSHMQELSSTQLVHVSRVDFLIEQVLIMHPLTAPVWMAGLVFFFSRRGAPYRALGWAYLTVLVVLLVMRGKAYYLAPAYPMLLAGGAVVIEGVLNRWRTPVLRPAILAILLISGIPLVPFGLPLLPPPLMARYAEAAGLEGAVRTEDGRIERLPQDYADMLGWEEQVASIAQLYDRLAPEEQRHTAIIADNYGEAGAIDYFGPRYGLPPATSTNSSYYYWGPGARSGETAIAIGASREDLEPYYEQVEEVARVQNEWAIWYESDLPIYLCRRLKRPLQEVWPELEE